MSHEAHTPTFTTEFGQEFEAEREQWLRKRFRWYTAVIAILNLISGIGALIALVRVPRIFNDSELLSAAMVSGVVALFICAIYSTAFFRAKRRTLSREQLIAATTFLIVGHGVAHFLGGFLNAGFAPHLHEASPLSDSETWMASILTTHFFACLFLPLTPREAVKPLIPLIAINLASALVVVAGAFNKTLVVVLSPLVGVPGVAICWWRQSRFRESFLQRMIKGRYLEMKRELVDARRIHEALFPAPVREGVLRFDYAYEPMRQIGGDYLHLCFAPAVAGGVRAMNLAVVDVTGHGIPAALTVNRLHGELQRIFAENPGTGPGEVLRLLNSYVHLTLAGHSVYVTAFCVKIDPESETIEYASGGHPPAFLRAVDGTIEQLGSTAFVLGACPGEDFRSDPRSLRFGPGDTLIAYTDGAIEARDRLGRYFGVNGLQRILATTVSPRDGGWPAIVTAAVDQHRFGPIADDTLVVEVRRPIDINIPKSAPVRAVASAGA